MCVGCSMEVLIAHALRDFAEELITQYKWIYPLRPGVGWGMDVASRGEQIS